MTRRNFVTHLECSYTGEHYPAGQIHGLSSAGKPLLVRYDLDAVAEAIDRDAFAQRPGGFWRYHELLPMRAATDDLDLGEQVTPLVRLPRFENHDGQPTGELWMKDEGRLPTGSFKARGLAVAVAMARELGIENLAMPTNGNAGAALAAYASRAGMRSTIFCPADTPEININEIGMQGADLFLVDGLINDCGKIVGQGKEKHGWFDVSTLKEPYRIEGKKTMGLELAEQFDWQLPEAIFYPTGGGTGLIGMWKAFEELEALGWIGSERPRMFAIQAEGCAPIVKAFDNGDEHAELWQNAHTVASGIRVPVAVGDFLILRAVRESGGAALAVSDEAILAGQRDVARREGVLMCPEGAATFAGWRRAVAEGLIAASDRSILFNCATGLKYPMVDSSRKFTSIDDI